MYLELYIDIIFLVNFIMDMIILIILKKLLKLKSTVLRIICAGATGGIGACIIAIANFNSIILKFILMYIVISSLMLIIAFTYRDFKNLLKSIFMLYVITFFLGGILNSLYYHFNIGFYFSELIRGKLYDNRNVKYYLYSALFTFVIVKILIFFYQYTKTELKNIYEVEIIMEDKKLTGFGLLDTGNDLREPLTNKPVIIGEYEFIKEIIPDCLKEIIVSYNKQENNLESSGKNKLYTELKDKYMVKIKIIPYHSIGKKNGNLIGIIFDEVNIKIENNVVSNKRVIVAIHLDELSTKEEYQFILHKKLL